MATDHETPLQESKTVLLVESDCLVCVVLADHLRECGYNVIEVSSAGEAMHLLASGRPVDTLFTEVNLPGEINGLILAGWARQHLPKVRTIVTSGTERAAREVSELCRQQLDLAKHDNPAELVLEIKRLLALESRRGDVGGIG